LQPGQLTPFGQRRASMYARHLDSSAKSRIISARFIFMSDINHPKKKHPSKMTTDEAMRHLFTKKGHKIIKKHVAAIEKSNTKKG